MAKPFGDLVDAEPGVQQVRGDEMPNLVRTERPDSGRDSNLIESASDVIRSQMPASSASEQVPGRPARCYHSSGEALEGIRAAHQRAEAVRGLRGLHPHTSTAR